MPTKVVIIGLDGATFALLRPWMDQGHLPYLKALVDGGTSGLLRSTIPPATVPAWQCFMTGKNPAKHGVVWFLRRRPDSYDEVPVDAASCGARSLWEILSERGHRVLVLNVPYATAPPRFNGVLIGGFDTPPSRMAEVAYPPGILGQIEQRLGPYKVQVRTPGLLLAERFEPIIEAFLEDCEALVDYQFRAAHDLLDRQAFDVVMFYQLVTDRIQHWLWYVLDPTHPWHGARAAGRFHDAVVAFYRRLDERLARLVERLGPEPVVLVVSDHGFGPVYKALDLSTWLLKEGYLEIRRRPASQLKLLLWRLGWSPVLLSRLAGFLLRRPAVQRWFSRAFAAQGEVGARDRLGALFNRLFLQRSDIDWARTRAYCLSGFGMIRLNVAGRDPQGAVRPDDYPAVRDEIAARLRRLVDDTTGRPIGGEVHLRDETYEGKYLEEMPDLVYLTLEQGYIIEQPMALPLVSRRVVIDDPKISGTHRMDGILIASGPSIRAGASIEGARLIDVAPTVLHLVGEEIPDDMDGRVLEELLEADPRRPAPRRYRAEATAARGSQDLSAEDQAVILDRLRGLGYID
ncbi:MAG: alkaline phosphatase family protein [Candidatus Rokubacteria bacterium]|nr:alkaline phosphatase family protein [Candidatus Rokubacteria bacterium]